MATFQDKITYLKTLLVEDGVGEVLERLKLMLVNNAERLNEIILLESSLQTLNKDLGFDFITRGEYSSKLANLRKTILEFLDSLQPQDLEPPTERKSKRKKKKRGHLLQRIPGKMQLFKRTKCVIRLAHLEEDLLENYKMTDDTVIKSVRIAEVMEVELQDTNEEPAFEIEKLTTEEQFVDEDDYTEWLFYVKPIRGGEHHLTLRISVLEEVRGKERRKDIVLEEVVTIVTEDTVVDDLYKPTGYEVNSTQPVETQAFTGFMQSIRKYSAVVALLIVGTMATWAVGTESGQYQIATWKNTIEGYDKFINKFGDNIDSKFVERARWQKALLMDSEEGYEEYLEETNNADHQKEADEKLEKIVQESIEKVDSTKKRKSLFEEKPTIEGVITKIDSIADDSKIKTKTNALTQKIDSSETNKNLMRSIENGETFIKDQKELFDAKRDSIKERRRLKKLEKSKGKEGIE